LTYGICRSNSAISARDRLGQVSSFARCRVIGEVEGCGWVRSMSEARIRREGLPGRTPARDFALRSTEGKVKLCGGI
jgi:hypothetical protein